MSDDLAARLTDNDPQAAEIEAMAEAIWRVLVKPAPDVTWEAWPEREEDARNFIEYGAGPKPEFRQAAAAALAAGRRLQASA